MKDDCIGREALAFCLPMPGPQVEETESGSFVLGPGLGPLGCIIIKIWRQAQSTQHARIHKGIFLMLWRNIVCTGKAQALEVRADHMMTVAPTVAETGTALHFGRVSLVIVGTIGTCIALIREGNLNGDDITLLFCLLTASTPPVLGVSLALNPYTMMAVVSDSHVRISVYNLAIDGRQAYTTSLMTPHGYRFDLA